MFSSIEANVAKDQVGLPGGMGIHDNLTMSTDPECDINGFTNHTHPSGF